MNSEEELTLCAHCKHAELYQAYHTTIFAECTHPSNLETTAEFSCIAGPYTKTELKRTCNSINNDGHCPNFTQRELIRYPGVPVAIVCCIAVVILLIALYGGSCQ